MGSCSSFCDMHESTRAVHAGICQCSHTEQQHIVIAPYVIKCMLYTDACQSHVDVQFKRWAKNWKSMSNCAH